MANKVSERGGIASVEHALRALTLLAQHESVGVSEIAAHLGVAPSSAHRLLVTLCSQRFAEQGRSRRYQMGPALAELSRDRSSNQVLCRLLHPYLAELARQLNETTHLVAMEGTDVRFLDSVEADQVLRVSSRVGRVLAAHTTSGGKALLAELPTGAIDGRYRIGLPILPRPAIGTLRQLHQELAVVRRRGYAVNEQESEPGIVAIGACIRSQHGRPVAALSASIPAARLPRRRIPEIADAVLHAAQRAGTAL